MQHQSAACRALKPNTAQEPPAVERLLTQDQVAELLQCDPRTVFTLRKTGRLPTVRLAGGLIRFDPIDVRALIDGSKTAGEPQK
jgi:excisionase family DNA binding protein